MTPADIAALVGMDVVEGETARDLQIRIEKRLIELQSVEGGTDEHRRLLAAREQLKTSEKAGGDLVPLPSVVVDRLLAAIEKQTASPPREERIAHTVQAMRATRVAASTKASQDFRRARSWPLAGLAGLVTVAWGTRDAFGVKLAPLSEAVWGELAAAALIACFAVYLASRSVQGRAEEFLRRLYQAEVQERALLGLFRSLPHPKHGRRGRPGGRWRFHRGEYRGQLYQAARGLGGYTIGRPISRMALRWSTVDVSAALDDAADLALQRLAELGLIEALVTPGGEMFAEVIQGRDEELVAMFADMASPDDDSSTGEEELAASS